MNFFLTVVCSVAILWKGSSSTLVPPQNHPFKSNHSNNLNESEIKTDPVAIGNIIHQLLNISKWTTTTTSTTTSTTLRPTNATTIKPTTPCQCGKGGTPKVDFRELRDPDDKQSNEESLFDISEELMDKFGDNNGTRIVHALASNPHAYPWMAGLINGYSVNGTLPLFLMCGGSLVNSQYVVTAAHCFNSFSTPAQAIQNISVILGSNSIKAKVTSRIVSRITQLIIHPKYNKSTSDNDIAMIKLAAPVPFTNRTHPICLTQAGSPFSNRKVVVAGWGATNYNGTNYPTYLREAGLTTLTNTHCKSRSNVTRGVTDNMICAVGSSPAANSNACFGDSGGPLMLYRPISKTFTLIGLTSFGPTHCGKGNSATVYTRVGQYIQFIQSASNGTAFCPHSFS